MILIVALGNPGKEYEGTRHNIGFMAIDRFAKKNDFPEFTNSKKNNSLMTEGFFCDKKVILAKPQTFMNKSGLAVKKIMKNTNCTEKDLWIIHDDADILIGKMKISENRGPAGHKGVQSVIENLGTQDFIRFRIGIGRQRQGRRKLENFVVTRFGKEEKEEKEKILKKFVQIIENSLKEGIEKSRSSLNYE